MQNILADMTVSMSEFKKNPASVLRQAHSRLGRRAKPQQGCLLHGAAQAI